ncbi:MAG: T9SS type A sorting domain-containing protein [Prevotellaceae bacterium]|nr:T9SS type A sorting domain-containing protein [Prevotellaceae bacterium]
MAFWVVKDAIRDWYKAGGNLLVTTYAYQYLFNDLGRVPVDNGVYSHDIINDNVESSNGYIQTFFGREERVGTTFNRSQDTLFAGLTNGVEMNFNGTGNCFAFPLLDNDKPMEKHNCFWHSDIVDYGNVNTGKYDRMYEVLHVTPLATRDGIGDYYGAGIARWDAWEDYQGEAITIGLGTYEWNQSGGNTHIDNIRQLTFNALSELNIKTALNVSDAYQISSSNKYKNITVQAGRQLTLASGISIEAETLTLKSDATGTATFINNGTANIATANVEQYLSTADSREWYYLASPVSGASSSVFGENDKLGYYNEATTSYTSPFDNPETLTAGHGYVVKLDASAENPTYTFSGSLNDGAVNIPVTRTGDDDDKRGFNLVGNPYPSYLDWDLASTSGNVQSTIWTRTFDGGMVFKTYNADSQVGDDDQTIAHIAPLQAFWVRVNDGATSATLDLTNDMRLHNDGSDAGLRAPRIETRELLRLQVSNGTNTDNAVILFDNRATDDFDSYDSEKMSNDNAAIPEIYTLAGTETVVINTFTGAAADREIALGFRTGVAGIFTISAITLNNLEKITLTDNVAGVEFDLTTGDYQFSSDVEDTDTRFTLAFRAPQTPTNISNAQTSDFQVWSVNGQIVVKSSMANGQMVDVYNVVGQKLAGEKLNSSFFVLHSTFPSGVYFVKSGNETRQIIVK